MQAQSEYAVLIVGRSSVGFREAAQSCRRVEKQVSTRLPGNAKVRHFVAVAPGTDGRMLFDIEREIQSGRCQEVFVEDTSRLSRDPAAIKRFIRVCDEHGVRYTPLTN